MRAAPSSIVRLCHQPCCKVRTRHVKGVHPLGEGRLAHAFACENCGHVTITRNTYISEPPEIAVEDDPRWDDDGEFTLAARARSAPEET